jgi:hypothetical protein
MIRPSHLVIALTILTLRAASSLAAGSQTSRVMGSIDIGAGEHSGDVSTVNGSIRVGDDAVVGRASPRSTEPSGWVKRCR